MVTISIIYQSASGRNRNMAEHVKSGAESLGAKVYMFECGAEIDWDILEKSDAIVFGSATYMGSVSGAMKSFFDSTSPRVFAELKWKNKIAAGFTNSGSMSGDKLNTLMQMVIFAMQHGMIWVGVDAHTDSQIEGYGKHINRLGGWVGAMSQSAKSGAEADFESDLETATYLGARVARIAMRIKG